MRFAAQPWLWVVPLLPVLWLALHLWEKRSGRRLRLLLGAGAGAHVEGRHEALLAWDRFLLLAGLFWLLIALARPQWGASEVTVTQRGSDVVVVLDISNSMRAEDVAPSRLERAKTELGSFLGRVQDSRIGLVFFAGAAFVQCPLTLDYGTADMFLKMADTDMLSEQGTNIGSALAAARQLLAKGRQGGPEAEGFQVDRFLLKLRIGYPTREDERLILERMAGREVPDVSPVLDPAALAEVRAAVNTVFIDEKIKSYVLDIVFASRDPEAAGLELAPLIAWGASPRATLALTQLARARALLRGRAFVVPEDVKAVGHDALRHRILVTYEAEAENLTSDDIVTTLLDSIAVP